jgi:hypothetical protein
MAIHFDEYEKQARQLEKIAKTLSKKSAKYAALKRGCMGAHVCHDGTSPGVPTIP